jgi:hypothetical protein
MCLKDFHDPTKEEKAITTGYKIFRRDTKGRLTSVWTHDSEWHIYRRIGNRFHHTKEPGFHCFLNLEDAQTYHTVETALRSLNMHFIICKVQVEAIISVGIQRIYPAPDEAPQRKKQHEKWYPTDAAAFTCKRLKILEECPAG